MRIYIIKTALHRKTAVFKYRVVSSSCYITVGDERIRDPEEMCTFEISRILIYLPTGLSLCARRTASFEFTSARMRSAEQSDE